MRAGQHFLDCPCAPAHCVLACCGWQYHCTRDCTLAKAPSCVDRSGDCADDEVTFPFHPQQKTTYVVLPLPDLRCTAPRQGCQSWQPQQLTVLTGLFAAAPPLCTGAELFWYSSLQQGGLLPAARCGSFTVKVICSALRMAACWSKLELNMSYPSQWCLQSSAYISLGVTLQSSAYISLGIMSTQQPLMLSQGAQG